jgi:hypothetical protein
MPAVQRSVDDAVWMGLLFAAGAALCELAPPGATRPHAVTSQAHPNRITSNLRMSFHDDDTAREAPIA